jgi:hypothetical protein
MFYSKFLSSGSILGRERIKKVELLARISDQVSGRFIRGYNLRTLGWPCYGNCVESIKALVAENLQNINFQEKSARLCLALSLITLFRPSKF